MRDKENIKSIALELSVFSCKDLDIRHNCCHIVQGRLEDRKLMDHFTHVSISFSTGLGT